MSFLTTPLDDALGSTTKVRLLRLFIEQDRTMSAREAARQTGMSLPAVLAALDDLVRRGLIERQESGRQFLCRVNRDHVLVQHALTPLFTAESEWTDRFFESVKRKATGDGNVVAAWLFGSVAHGRDRPGSDVDLFVLTSTDDAAKQVADRLLDAVPAWRREFGADVRPVVMSRRKAVSQRRAGNTFIANAVRDARVIVGAIPKELERGQTHDNASRR